MKTLLIGCGNSRTRKITMDVHSAWDELVTLDMDRSCSPDVVWDLNEIPLPFGADEFDDIHAYEVLEHVGSQGDWRFFFRQFEDFWRVLKPGGYLCGTTPHPESRWAWGDPGHTRIVSPDSFVFLSQEEYRKQIGKTAMTDYRPWYKADFELVHSETTNSGVNAWVLRAIKGE